MLPPGVVVQYWLVCVPGDFIEQNYCRYQEQIVPDFVPHGETAVPLAKCMCWNGWPTAHAFL